jgi:hypothetical protein
MSRAGVITNGEISAQRRTKMQEKGRRAEFSQLMKDNG